jgi:iron only hydrogenase large subunit-like protein
MSTTLSEIIEVDKHKCVSCHTCISVCPVMYCNNASQNHVTVNPDLCIACGTCIDACTHNARRYLDDTQRFFEDISQNIPMVVVVAPSVASNFRDTYLQLNGYFKSLGISAIFDVSFGAELTIKSLLNHAEKNKPASIIAHPCPSIVTYIELYQPELLPYLSPVDSPVMHTIKMVKTFYPEYKDHKIAFISPCAAKRREFDEVKLGDYVVTMKSLNNKLLEYGINLENFPKVDFDNPPAERAVLFSTPGGLLRTAERENPEIMNLSRKIEGPDKIYPYLEKLPKMITKGFAPQIVDCLSCKMGCNGGPGSLNRNESPDMIEHFVEKRNKEMQERYNQAKGINRRKGKRQLRKNIEKYWNEKIYQREYMDLSQNNTLRIPNYHEIESILHSMNKFNEADYLNCGACGYGSCENMVFAVYNGLNRPENCHHFSKSLILNTAKTITRTVQELATTANTIKDVAVTLYSMSDSLNNEFAHLNKIIKKNAHRIMDFDTVAETLHEISQQTKVLSVNAAIEAAKAGKAGKGFTIVAKEVKQLAFNSNKEANKIKPYLIDIELLLGQVTDNIQFATDEFNKTTEMSKDVSFAIEQLSGSFSDLYKKSMALLAFTD